MSIMDKIKRRDDTIARLKNEVRRLENFRRLADRQKDTIGKLTRQLSAEARQHLLFAINRLSEMERIYRNQAKERWNSGCRDAAKRFRDDANNHKRSIDFLKSLLPNV